MADAGDATERRGRTPDGLMFGAIHLPAFALQAALRWHEDWRDQPGVVVDPTSGLVVGQTVSAAARGIDPGLTTAQAMARCEGLRVLHRSAAQERAVTALLVECALRHSPFVEATAPDLVTLDLRGLHPKVSWHQVGDELLQGPAAAGLDGRGALAKNAAIARLAAREAAPVSVVRDTGEFLRPLPLAFLHPPPALLAILHGWGVTTIGEFLDLPAQETLERLGTEARPMWRMASGRDHTPLRLVPPPETFEETCDLGYGVETTEPLLFLLRRFLDSLSERLRARWLVASRMTLTLPLDDGGAHERCFVIPEPTAAGESLFRIAATHLETLTLAAKPTGLHLRVEPAPPSRQQFALFGTALRDPNRFGETLARLGALVGADRVGFPEPEDTYRPDRVRLAPRVSWQIEEEIHDPTPTPPGLPLRRCRPPAPAQVTVLDRRPAQISSAPASGRIDAALGPYRLSGHWWEPGAWRTEEWDVELDGGGLFRIARTGKTWRVEGSYDVL